MNDADYLATVYYLLLQDRIEEAQAAFARVNPDKVPTRVQYDYCAAYMALFEENPVKARSIASRHLGHPVDRWRNTFAAVISHIDEAEGKGPRSSPIRTTRARTRTTSLRRSRRSTPPCRAATSTSRGRT